MSENRPEDRRPAARGGARGDDLWQTGSRRPVSAAASRLGADALQDSAMRRRAASQSGNVPRQTAGDLSDSALRRRAAMGQSGNAPRQTTGDLSDSALRRRAAMGQSGNAPRQNPANAPRRPSNGPASRRTSASGRRDVFMERPRARRSSLMDAAATVVLTVGIVVLLVSMLRQRTGYADFQRMQAEVARHNTFEGVTVEGLSVSGATLEQSLEYWANNVEPAYAERTVSLSTGEFYSAKELGYSSDYDIVLMNAWNAGRKGTLAQRYQSLAERSQDTTDYPVTRTLALREEVEKRAEMVAQAANTPPQNASIQGFDVEHRTFRFNESVDGAEVDQPLLVERILQTLEQGGGQVEVPFNVVAPEITTEDVSSRYGVIASAVTDATGSDENRLSNLRVALSRINGYSLEPGEAFSFNDVVGERSEATGFMIARAYGDGDIIEEYGGGICQISTTLFNAVVKADLKVKERHNHSMPVAYVDKGKDAAVNWRNKDLRFTNTSEDRVYIVGYLTSDNRVKIGVYGRLLADGVTITVETETLEEMEFQTEYRSNAELEPGEERILREGKLGYTAQAYKVRWDADGNVIKRSKLCKSIYKPVSAIIEVGPKA